ncbi:hypothetical protein HPB49_002689 [Dermacentor silvarum]|uniref:Uncharacterized protein n=1 Tax=Dermacentor silvarum TaxID=543639 RepID=A0ACB8CP39_DERSI|nr:hypothetical protein HPB49_002689 [Dermacentor silvarum]
MAANVVCLAILENGQRKKLTLQTGLQEELLTALSSLTTITDSTLIQIFDDEIEDFIDMEPGTPVHNKAKIKLMRKLVPQADCTSPPQDTSTEVHCANAAATSSISGLESIAGTSSTVIEAPVPLEDRHDYIHFVMPSFGPYEEVLSRGTTISGPVRRAIIDRLFQACYRLAWYPSRELYRTAAEGLVLKYPHLLDNVGGRASGLESWVLSLRNKFKNMRKKVENCPPEMMEKRAQSQHKRPRQPSSLAPNKKLCRLFLLLEFDIVFQKNIGDDFAQGCEQLCDIVLKHADDTEVAAFSNVATENPILATFEFVAARCKESLSVVLSETWMMRGKGQDNLSKGEPYELYFCWTQTNVGTRFRKWSATDQEQSRRQGPTQDKGFYDQMFEPVTASISNPNEIFSSSVWPRNRGTAPANARGVAIIVFPAPGDFAQRFAPR